jgi:tetratricopeptide (TPR) repeat protein
MSQLRVFLSHSSQDKAAADQFATAFRQAGANVWYDEESLGAGHLRRTIMKELAERPIFVVLLSPVALASTWVLDECEWAYDLQRHDPSRVILPVVTVALEWADLNPALYLRSLKRVEAGDLRPVSTIADAASQALRLLGMTPAGQVSAPSAPQTSESAADLVLRGRGLSAQKQYADAVPLFERATQLEPDNWEAWANLGYVLGELEHWQEELPAVERALTLKPSDAVGWYNKGRALYGLKRNEEALSAYDRALMLDPNNAFTWGNKGNVLRYLKRYDEALVAYDRSIALGNDPIDWNGKGAVLQDLKRYDEALAAYEQTLTLDPKVAIAWANKGNVLYLLQRNEEALLAYERATTLDSNYTLAWTWKAATLRRLGRTAEAEAAERRAKELGG